MEFPREREGSNKLFQKMGLSVSKLKDAVIIFYNLVDFIILNCI